MSIRDVVKAYEADGPLFEVRHNIEGMAAARCVMATEHVQKLLTGPWETVEQKDRYMTVKALIDLFINGETMAIRVPPSKSAKAQLALLEPLQSYVWEFRTRPEKKRGSPYRYGVRVFGMFADRDLFVAFSAVFKEDLLDESDYLAEIAFCRQRWNSLFNPYNPNLGMVPDAYLSNYILSR